MVKDEKLRNQLKIKIFDSHDFISIARGSPIKEITILLMELIFFKRNDHFFDGFHFYWKCWINSH